MTRPILQICLLLAAISVTSPASASWTHDPSANEPIAVVTGDQWFPRVAADGEGGVFITWQDSRSGEFDIYVQHVDGSGTPLWGANGLAICTATNAQTNPVIVSDGAGGAIVAWLDLRAGGYQVFAQRVNGAGVAQWAANGIALCAVLGSKSGLEAIADGAGGLIAVWSDTRCCGTGIDVYTQRANAAGTLLWAAGGVALTTAANDQITPRLTTDGAGGAIVCWQGNGSTALYGAMVQRISGAGVVQWAANGIAMESDFPFSPRIVSDGAGGALVAYLRISSVGQTFDGTWVKRLNGSGVVQWSAQLMSSFPVLTTYDIVEVTSDGAGGAIAVWSDLRNGGSNADLFARRVTASGVRLWTANGVPVCTALSDQQGWHPIIPDGKGGAIIAWHDPRQGFSWDVFVQRLDPNGVPQWETNGKNMSTAPQSQVSPMLATDGRNGTVVVWHDDRNGWNVYAQRVDDHGHYGDPAPEIAWVKDVPNDQGERVRIRWNASYRDTFPTLGVEAYGIWRQVSEAAASAAIARGARVSRAGDGAEPAPGVLRVQQAAAQATWWEGVGTVLARGEPWYTFAAETFQDSTSAGNPLTTFMVDAHDAVTTAFWSSVSASGYSVDNIPPAMPQAFTGNYQSGAMHLDWGDNIENDLAVYGVYRGTAPDFVPSLANRIATPAASGYVDAAAAGFFYKVSALDVHGNESAFAMLPGTTDTGDGPAALDWGLGPPNPNPAYTAAALRLTLPQPGAVSLAIFDASGRRVRQLLTGVHPAGEQMVRWDLSDERGARVAGGLYFARLDAGGRTLTRRIVAVR